MIKISNLSFFNDKLKKTGIKYIIYNIIVNSKFKQLKFSFKHKFKKKQKTIRRREKNPLYTCLNAVIVQNDTIWEISVERREKKWATTLYIEY